MEKLIKEYKEYAKQAEELFKKKESRKPIISKMKKIREQMINLEIEQWTMTFQPLNYV